MTKKTDEVRIGSALITLQNIQREFGPEIKVSLGGPCLTVKEAIRRSKKAAQTKGFKIKKGVIVG